jgi:hypothetical protein
MHNQQSLFAVKESIRTDGFASPYPRADLGCEVQDFLLRPILKTTQNHVKWGNKVFA